MIIRSRHARRFVILSMALALLSGCSMVKGLAVDMVASSMAEGGQNYASDPDPELIREALPFGLKTQEGFLEVSPGNANLRLAAARGFAAYAFLLQQEAATKTSRNTAREYETAARVGRLFLRCRDHGLRGLETAHPGFKDELTHRGPDALASTTASDVPLLYWSGVCWAGAVSERKDDFELLAELPLAAALVNRVITLDEGFDGGAAHEFMVNYEGNRPGGSAERARAHYAKALALSKGQRASLHLALAEGVVVRSQRVEEFKRLLDLALSVDPDAAPENRLVNVVARRRASWLSGRIPELFLDYRSGRGRQ